MSYNDPNHAGNSPRYHNGDPCIVPGCQEPAGTAWSPYWCFRHNVERIDRINRSLEDIARKSTPENQVGYGT